MTDTSQQSEVRLEPCPLFGHQPQTDWATRAIGPGPYLGISGPVAIKFYSIICPGCCSTASFESRERAITAWNSRALVAPQVDATANEQACRDKAQEVVMTAEHVLGEQLTIAARHELVDQIVAAFTSVTAPVSTGEQPIDMILFCPRCGTQHVDAPEDETAFRHRMEAFGLVAEPQDSFPSRWTNPPHRSHLCHNCYAVWRPADVPTNGVAQIGTRGKGDNTWTNSAAVPAATSTPVDRERKFDYAAWLCSLPDWLDSNREPDGSILLSRKVADQTIEILRVATTPPAVTSTTEHCYCKCHVQVTVRQETCAHCVPGAVTEAGERERYEHVVVNGGNPSVVAIRFETPEKTKQFIALFQQSRGKISNE